MANIENYQGNKKKFKKYFMIVIILLIFFSIYAVSRGAVSISFQELIEVFSGKNSGYIYNIIWKIRLPRIFTAIIAGVGLAISGAVMQSILKNPLGSPFTLGISQAAAFGAAFSIIFFKAGSQQSAALNPVIINNPLLVSISAFFWSVISIIIILMIAKYKGIKPEIIILTGVAMASIFTAGTTALQYFADDVELASIVFWTFGDVGRTTWNHLLIMFIAVLIVLIYFIYNSWNYNLMDSGDETAKSLGVEVSKIRVTGMFLASLITSLIVSFVGIIGFIGLIVPHMARKIVGNNKVYLLPMSALGGGLLLLVSDIIARTIIAPVVLPVGILTSFMGGPLFIYLVLKGR